MNHHRETLSITTVHGKHIQSIRHTLPLQKSAMQQLTCSKCMLYSSGLTTSAPRSPGQTGHCSHTTSDDSSSQLSVKVWWWWHLPWKAIKQYHY